MQQNDPGFALNCPGCGARLRYGASTDSGTMRKAGDVFKPGADTPHYACASGSCGRFWQFGPGTGLLEDPLRLAAGRARTH